MFFARLCVACDASIRLVILFTRGHANELQRRMARAEFERIQLQYHYSNNGVFASVRAYALCSYSINNHSNNLIFYQLS